MIINRLELRNIGVFGDTTTFDLSPENGRPIVLVGGRNGSGKTTLLEAVQWCLYGALTKTPRRLAPEVSSYSDYLERLRNRKAADEAYAELLLSVRRGRRSTPIKVRRSIRNGNGRLADHLQVWIDGESLADAAAEWPVHMDGILPNQLATLFFFDGEQIESMVDPAQSRHFLRAGLLALLGIDLIDQVVADLDTLQQRKRVAAAPRESSNRTLALEERRDQLSSLLRQARDREADAQSEVDQAERSLARAEERFRTSGGAQFEQRARMQLQLKQAEAERQRIEVSMREAADGPLPILLVSGLAASLHADAVAESERAHAHAAAEASTHVLDELVRWLTGRRAAVDVLEEVSTFCAEWKRRAQLDGCERIAQDIAGECASRLQALVPGGLLEEGRNRASELSAQMQRVERQIAGLSRSMATLPEQEDVASLQDTVKKAENRRTAASASLRAAQTESRRLDLERERVINELRSEVHNLATAQTEADRLARTIDSCKRSQDVLAGFRRAVVEANLCRVEEAIWRRFRRLTRKEQLGTGARIDPETYELAVCGEGRSLLPPERLSAGERQLLATSVLWGLADASGRRLPVIIDTPLGRLDGTHRQRLVDEYFPNAGRQVVLLSTDEEISTEWHRRLRSCVARSFTLEFDERSQTSTLRHGYFEDSLNVT